jgi:flagellin-like protein
MKTFRQNKKALSPVVASIILIAVTVAVSIAVASWMGALTIGQMQTEELKITGIQFTGTTVVDKAIVISVSNQGTDGFTISEVSINGQSYTPTYNPSSSTVNANGHVTVTVPFDWTLGNNYQVKLSTAKGNVFMYSAVA